MKTFLFAWNPKKWNWTTLDEDISLIESTGRATIKWSVQSHKKIKPGDRAFLMRLGKEPKGIMAAGFVSTPPFLAPHWRDEDKLVNRVLIDFEVILNPDIDPLLNLDLLEVGDLASVNWTPQSSGIEIDTQATDELEAIWFDFLITQKIKHNPFQKSELDDQNVYTEGSPNQVVITKYERNPFARKACIDHYGLTCMACGFNFEKVYGEIGKEFIHVHHLTEVSSVGSEYTIDPIHDLRPVCPNCHAMIHKRKVPYSIDEVCELIKNNENG